MTQHYDVAIIGAGPAGLSAATNAASHGLSHVLIERKEIGNTIFDYQLKKLVMAEPQKLPLRAKVPFEAGSREEVLESWNNAVAENKVNTLKGEIKKIEKVGEHFKLHLGADHCTAGSVILAIGVQGSPRLLEVPGAELPHVSYTLSDPDAFRDMDILVIGAGDAAIENALALAPHNRVSLLNKTDDFPRAKEANATKITQAINSGKIKMYINSDLLKVTPTTVFLSTPQGEIEVKCSRVIARIGCIMPRKFLEDCGITFPNKDPLTVPVVNSRYESNVPNLYILGALIGYPLIKQAINQGYEVIEHLCGNHLEPADQVLIEEKLKVLPGEVNQNLEMIKTALPHFKDLSEAQFRELIIDSSIHVTKEEDKVFEKHDYTDTFFSIVRGSVQIHLKNGKKVEISNGEFFGEMGLTSGRRRMATVSAYKPGILLESPRKQILKLMSSVENFKKEVNHTFILRSLKSKVFPEADPEFLNSLTQKTSMKNFRKGEIIFKEGDKGDVLYLIRKGSVKLSCKGPHNTEITQRYVAAGNLLGEGALLSIGDEKRKATASAAVPCETIVIQKDDFIELLQKNPKVKQEIETLLRTRQVEQITQEMDSHTGQVLDFMMAEGVTDADNFLLIDSDLCIGCDNCEKACAATHGGFSRLDRKGGKSFAHIQIPISCRHCENPLCMLDCPPDALSRMPNGEVIIKDSCIGCGNCIRNCPYGVIQLGYEKPKHSGSWLLSLFKEAEAKAKGPAKAAKCDMCAKLSGGPACVRSCPTGAAVRVNPAQMFGILSRVE